MWQANKDWIKIKNIGGRRPESLQEKEMLSAVYLFHFPLIIGSVGANIRISIFSVTSKEEYTKFYAEIFHHFPRCNKYRILN